MRKTTDINGLKDVAKMMLHLPMTETEFDFIVNHPVFQSPYWFDNEKIINIKDSEKAFEKACAAYEQKIDKRTAFTDVYIPFFLLPDFS